jgi:hypothetical protein
MILDEQSKGEQHRRQMASKKSAQDLLAGFDDLPDDTQVNTSISAAPADTNTTGGAGGTNDDDEANINEFLAEFSRDRPSRPQSAQAGRGATVAGRATPRMSGEKARKASPAAISRTSGESRTATSTAATSTTASPTKTELKEAPAQSTASWGSWGGSLWNTASALAAQTKQEAEKRLAELQHSEEAQKLQARLRAVDLAKIAAEARELGKGVLDAVAPPIAGAEVLVVHVAHDLQGVRVKKTVQEAFEGVMEQVEGGHLTILARDLSGEQLALEQTQGGLKDARKLCEAAIEDLARDAADQGASKPETKERQTTAAVPDSSLIYLALQAYTSDSGAEEDETVVQLLLTLSDPINKIEFATLSQGVPLSWLDLAKIEMEAETQPVEWVTDAISRGLGLATTVLAQRYVARRMGIDGTKTAPGTPAPGQAPQTKNKLASKQSSEVGEAGLGL